MAAGSTTFYKNDGTDIYTVGSFIGFPTVESLGWSRDEYTFASWNTRADGTGVSFAEGSSDPNPDETGYGAYYAIWKYVPTYLDFDGLSTYDSLIKTEINGKVDVGGKAGGIPYGNVDSTSTSTVFTATVDGLTELYDGACMMLHNGVVTSAKDFTINVNGLGAKKCYSNMTNATQESTVFNVAYTMLFIYSTALDSGNGGWWLYRGYNSDTNTIGYQLRTNSTVRNVSDTARYYKLYFTSADGTMWVPASVNSTSNATSARPVNQRPIDPFGRIVYTSASTSYAAGANLAATTIWDQYTFSLGYSFNRTGEALVLTAEQPVYLKCAPQDDGSAIMDADEPIVQQLPATVDGKIYVFLGIAYSATNIELVPHHPVYWYDGTGIRLWTGAEPPTYTLPPATESTLGGVKVGSGLTVAADGTASIADGAVTGIKLAQDVKEAINISSAADALMGDPSESTWSRRTSTGSGMARVESVQGAAVGWNQRFSVANGNISGNQGTKVFDSSTGIWTITNTNASTTAFGFYSFGAAIRGAIGGHKTLVRAKVKLSTAGTVSFGVDSSRESFAVASDTFTNLGKVVAPASNTNLVCYTNGAEGLTMQVKEIESIDLTAMFGAGNEPATVAEFERMFPEPYYPYSEPTLKPVTIAGIKSTGRNLIDLNSPYGNGVYNAEVGYQIVSGNPTATPSGENPCAIAVHSAWNGVMFVSERLTVGNTYRLAFTVSGDGYRVTIYTLDANHVIARRLGNYTTETQITSNITVKSNESYIALSVSANVANMVFLTNTMLQVATADFNTYKPYTTDSVEWETQTLRAAGSVRDELTADELVTRVGVVDLGTLRWTYNSEQDLMYANVASYGFNGVSSTNIETTAPHTNIYVTADHNMLRIYGTGYDNANTFKAAMEGVYAFIDLLTPTTTPISPALPMSYKVEQGGTESIIVPEGEVSAAPLITLAEGESAANLVMDALACIATPDGPTATANHAVGTYLTMGGKLYKVTSAIAVGESIVAGTNVTETTVMDETGMVVLEYGVSTWADFLAAYEANRIVYCRVNSTYGPRMAFLAFVHISSSNPGAEFQYYRSLSSHSDAAQGDEVYIYHLSTNGTWSTTVRKAYTRIVAGEGLKSTYANGVLTISLDQ